MAVSERETKKGLKNDTSFSKKGTEYVEQRGKFESSPSPKEHVVSGLPASQGHYYYFMTQDFGPSVNWKRDQSSHFNSDAVYIHGDNKELALPKNTVPLLHPRAALSP